jgi:hypothetical protein
MYVYVEGFCRFEKKTVASAAGAIAVANISHSSTR